MKQTMNKFNWLTQSLTVLAILFAFTMQAQLNESFADGDFTSNPVWSGDTGQWTVYNNSTAGVGVVGSMTLRMTDPTAGSGVEYLSTPHADWGTSQTWAFFLGRRSQSLSNSNKVYVWLYADEANLESPSVNGYRIRMGETGTDHVILESVTAGVGTAIITSGGIGATSDFGVDIVVERSITGLWTLKTSIFPAINGTGAKANDDPLSSAFLTQGTAIDNTHALSGANFVGIVGHHSSGSNARSAIELDQFTLTTLSNDTYVEFIAPVNVAYSEFSGAGVLPMSILYESAVNATTVDVVLLSGDATRINNYTTQTVTFPAGSSTPQFLPITITNNLLCDGNETLVFQLQNISGGNSALIGANSFYILEIIDDETGFATIIEKDFEDQDVTEWIQNGGSSWDASNTTPITGNYSMRHQNDGLAGISSSAYNLNKSSLRGLETTWQFNFNYYGHDPSANNNFVYYLSANESDLTSATVDGYAVGVRPGAGSGDLITLWKMIDGAAVTPIVVSSYDLNNTDYAIGIQVTRDEFGNWELLIDDDGGFEDLISEGVGVNLDYNTLDFTGIYYKYTSSLSGKLSVDDISIKQEGCKFTYYSQGSGNIDAAIWALTPIGVPTTVSFNRFVTLITQNTHDMTMNLTTDVFNLYIENGGSWDASSHVMKLYGSFDNEGGFTSGTSKVFICGNGSQAVGGTVPTRFYDLILLNIGGDVYQTGDLEIINVFSPLYGEYDTDGNSFKLISTGSNSASIGAFSDEADFYGEIVMQRHIPADAVLDSYPGGWVHVGNPLISQTIADWNDNIITTGFTGADYEYSEYPFVNILSYDETNVGAGGEGWIPATNVTNPLSTTNAYAVYMIEDAQSMDAVGEFKTHGITQMLDYTNTGDPANDGWNLLTNQYPSEIDFTKMYNYSGGITSYSVWDAETYSYLVYNAATAMGTGSQYIASSQGFWVQATAGGQFVQYQEDIKSNTGVSFERDTEFIEQVEISINQGFLQDRTFLGFYDDATVEFDASYDLRKIKSSPSETGLPLTISSISNNDEMSINVLPTMIEDMAIPLHISVSTPGFVSIAIENVLGLPESSCIILEDLITNETYTLTQGEEFIFEVEEAYEGNRFLIHFGAPIQIVKSDISCYGDTNGEITAQGQGEGPFDYTWYDENDEIINQELNVSGPSTLSELALGNYSVEVTSTNGLCGTITEMVYIDQPQEQIITWSTEPDLCHQINPGVIVIEAENTSEFDYEIRDENNIIVSQGTSTTTIVEEFTGGLYQVSVSTSCNLYQFQADLTDPNAVSVQIEDSETYVGLIDNAVSVVFDADFSTSGTITWTIDGQIESIEESFEYIFTATGDYYVMAIIENEEGCYETDEQIIHVSKAVDVEEMVNINTTFVQYDNRIDLSFDETIGNAQFEVINLLGQIIITHPVSFEENVVISENISILNNGAYILRIRTDNDLIFARKFIK